MKAGLAALTMAYAFLATHRELWRGQLSYSAVADETVFGGDGAGWLLSKRPDLVGDALICGEGPGAMQLAVAEKGLLWVEIEATAPSGQGLLSQRGGSAITRLAGAVTQLDRMNDEHAAPPTDLSSVAASAGDQGLRLSVNTGTVHGGTFVSQSAARAVAEIDFRIPPGLTIDDIDRRLNEVCRSVPGSRASSRQRLESKLDQPARRHRSHPRGSGGTYTRRHTRASRAASGKRCEPMEGERHSRDLLRAPSRFSASGVDDFVNTQDVIDCVRVYALSALNYLT